MKSVAVPIVYQAPRGGSLSAFNEMIKLTASATLCVGLTLLATQAVAQHKTNSGVVNAQREYVRLAEVCAFGFWCDTGIVNSSNPAPLRPLVTPKAKLAHGIDRSQFRPEIASHPELVVRLTHMVFGEAGTHHCPSRSSSLRQRSIARRRAGRRWRMCCCQSTRAPATAITPSTPIVRPQSRRWRKLRRSRRPCSLWYCRARICPTLDMAQ